MKITKSQLKRIIKEEFEAILLEEAYETGRPGTTSWRRAIRADARRGPSGFMEKPPARRLETIPRTKVSPAAARRPRRTSYRAPDDYTPAAATMSPGLSVDTAERYSDAYNLGFEAGQKGLSMNDAEAGYMSLGGEDQAELRRDWEAGYGDAASEFAGKGSRSREDAWKQSQKTGAEGDKPTAGGGLYLEGTIKRMIRSEIKKLR